ncbi:acyltransferase [Reichenbachiella agarivorans]|uniref:Acyltransferase n=1 Tax=Reichenbachiella agarivorans TaxID=2979464 RepID=A0ABY6CRG4_9BACT|nr:acyltransferase [Reichenbachiella agarivorans]UXP32429.1 acyltransferase [Reichenbachiella agarivorans]
MDQTKNDFLGGIHYFRGIAILLIVSSHLLYADLESNFYFFTSAVYLNSTIFYVFISGYLFQHLAYKFDYKKYLKRKWLNVMLPYLIVSIPALTLRWYSGPSYLALQSWPDIGESNAWCQLAFYLATGSHLLPLWYLPMIAIFFVLGPIFKLWDDSPRMYWLLPLLLVVSLLFPRNLENMNDIPRMFVHFASIYVLGMWYSRNLEMVRQWVSKYIVVVSLGLLVLFVFCLYEFPWRHQFIFVQKVVAIPVLMHFLDRIKGSFWKDLCSRLAETSFGIYFIHFYVILGVRVIMNRILHSEYPRFWYEWLIEWGVVVIISYVFVMIVKMIFKNKSRYLIGS